MTKINWMKFARPLGFVSLALVTLVGIYSFATGDSSEVLGFWRGHLMILPVLALLSLFDVVLEAAAWMWVYHRLGVRSFDRRGVLVYLAGRAGLLLPAQLGRLIRPYAMVNLSRGSLRECLKAEGAVFVLDGISVVALLVGLLAYRFNPAAGPLVAVGVVGVLVFLGNQIARLITHENLRFPPAFWLAWPSVTIVLIGMLGWLAHGLALHVVIADLPGDMSVWDSLFFAPASAVLGVSTGLPGGIGATEGILGASLQLRSVPLEHLAIAVAAFRLITFWVWIPIGWLALLALRRCEPQCAAATAADASEDQQPPADDRASSEMLRTPLSLLAKENTG